MAPRWILFDWGDTLMSEDGPVDLPMALWPEVRALEGALATLTALAARHRLAVATNATVSDAAMIRRALARVSLDALVAELFCFRDLGVKKASPAFWDAVVARLGVGRDELVMVGDDLDGDVLAPRRAGIAAVWLDWKRTRARDGVAGPIIERLEQLPATLAQLFGPGG
jgi:putative hydrolase of the HAD superfamily